MTRRLLALTCLLAGLTPAPALAQPDGRDQGLTGLGFGIKGGLGLGPDQLVVGAQVSIGKALGVFRMVPNVDIGLGDNVTTVDFNLDFLARFILEGSTLGIYGGGAPTLALSNGDANLGATFVAGVQLPLLAERATNLEARFGVGKVPDFRLLLTIVF